jgi:D-hexose-6-phosphate mutarotase
MPTVDLQALNDQFAIPGYLTFSANPEGFPIAEIANQHATAQVALAGGQVARYQPRGAEPALWVSRLSSYAVGKAIRGGIPVCWPWFAQHPSDPSKPFHGFARTLMWQVRGSGVMDDATELRLGLAESEATLEIWPYPFDLELAITVGPQLRAELIARNTGEAPFTAGGALHTYFQVGDVTRVAIHGLDGTSYIDKVDGGARKTQAGPVTITAETDRIYLDTDAECVIDDPALGRRIRVGKSGSRTTVVWNPWAEKARQIPDCGDEEYLNFVCVETTNAVDDVFEIAPGGEHRLVQTVAVEAAGQV